MKILCIFLFCPLISFTQVSIRGKVSIQDSTVLPLCKVGLKGSSHVTSPDSSGNYLLQNVPIKNYEIQCYCPDYKAEKKEISVNSNEDLNVDFKLSALINELNEVAAMGTLKETVRSESPIITDIYDKKFFTKNPSPSLIDIMDRMNGVRPQVNCNVCGTGDIHLNGLEGGYTLIVLDGVPIVGGLSSVYGLSGIPTFLLDRVEVTKGPASSLYGSEAVAGVIHAFSKKPSKQPEFHFQHYATSQLEFNTDLGVHLRVGKKVSVFTTGNYFFFNRKLDQNNDLFTDVPLQNRWSVYQKWTFERAQNRLFSISARFMHEKRWGGQLNWDRSMRGSDSIYAETIDLNRAEINLVYQLPTKEKILLLAHTNVHIQDSYYGKTRFDALQKLGFYQLTWEKKFSKHQFLSGVNIRQTWYDDNTILTQSSDSLPTNAPVNTFLPGIFWQHDIKPNERIHILLSSRLDHHPTHGFIYTPRIAISKKFARQGMFRFHAGTGFRVVNLFSEDHAALTGSRQVVILEDLKPERSLSMNSSYSKSIKFKSDWTLELDVQVFYTYFLNRIVPDFESNANQIIYSNIDGYGESYGTGFDLKLNSKSKFSAQLGITLMEVSISDGGIKKQQILTEKASGNWTITYQFSKIPLSIDYTGNCVGPMRLPVLNALDPRPAYSPTYSIQNIQFTYKINEKIQCFGGVKNLLNWTPAKGLPFLIARSNDPFDKQVVTDANGQILATPNNPYALSFDPAYVYAPNQGIRAFFGFRLLFKQKEKTIAP